MLEYKHLLKMEGDDGKPVILHGQKGMGAPATAQVYRFHKCSSIMKVKNVKNILRRTALDLPPRILAIG
jgi:hypothetical protein